MEISPFYVYVPEIMIRWCMVPEIWCTMDGRTDRWMDRRKKWHIEVGAPPKNPQETSDLKSGKNSCLSHLHIFTPLWRTIKNSGPAGSRWEDNCRRCQQSEKEIRIWKRQVFEEFNCSNCADKEKDKSNYRLPSIFKNNGKKYLKLYEVRKGKVVSSNFEERFNWEKARKNTN